MDEAAAAAPAAPAVSEDGAGEQYPNGDPASGDSMCTSAEDAAESDAIFCCQDCGEAFIEEAAYTEHCHQHQQENTHLGKQIDGFHSSSVESSMFHSHVLEEHGEVSQKQPDVQHSSGTTNQSGYECPECGKCYEVLGHFINHQRTHKQASKSVFHDLEHLKKKSFQCESCGRSYSRASALDAHRRCHEEKLVKSRSRSSGDAVQTEESTVEVKLEENQTDCSPKQIFKCSCEKEFASSMALKTHQRFSHNSLCTPKDMENKPKKNGGFPCSDCDKVFSSYIALFNHQRWHSNFTSDPSKSFPCELCGKVFRTLSFYYRHQRTMHSEEAPAKSFHHQVCQLQKKSFECQDCGLRFSRASALHSHQLHHTDHFRETETGVRTHLLPQWNTPEGDRKDSEQEQRKSEDNMLFTSTAENELKASESDDDIECYGPGDFNVQVISASESEDEPVQDLNPDLELLCESDQEQRDDSDSGPLPSRIFSKPEMDLKIVQIDFEQTDAQCAPIEREPENNSTGERFDCPDCYRWFTSATSLRTHRMWHGIRKRRHQAQGTQVNPASTNGGLQSTNLGVSTTHLQQHVLTEEEAGKGEKRSPGAQPDLMGVNYGVDLDGHTGSNAHPSTMSTSVEKNPLNLVPRVRTNDWKKKPRTCYMCGKVYLYRSALMRHQRMHGIVDHRNRWVYKEGKFECPQCGLEVNKKSRLRAHMKIHRLKLTLKSDLKCGQCNKFLKTEHTFKNHIKLHRLKPFWCLSCSRGFSCKEALDKHLSSHNPRKLTCNVCTKSFLRPAQLMYHLNLHTGLKPFPCTVCWKAFSYPGTLIAHQNKNPQCRTSLTEMEEYAEMLALERQEQIFPALTNVGDTNMSELPEEGDWMEGSRRRKIWDDGEFRDSVQDKDINSEETQQDCKIGQPLGLAALRSEMFQPQIKQQDDQTATQDTIMYEEHKYWEWECCVCEMGFDEEAELHMHYIKHATAELPIPHDDLKC